MTFKIIEETIDKAEKNSTVKIVTHAVKGGVHTITHFIKTVLHKVTSTFKEHSVKIIKGVALTAVCLFFGAVYVTKPKISVLKILFSVLYTSLFICVFFFTLGHHLETSVLEKQVNQLVKVFVGDYAYLIPDSMKSAFLSQEFEVDTSKDQAVEDSNQVVVKSAIHVISYFVLFMVALALWIVWWYRVQRKSVVGAITHALSGTCFVAITYMLFAFSSGLNYTSADPNYVKKIFVGHLKTKL